MRIDATYRVVTPCFCAGADPTCAELRLPSFKGALRFWWRALAWQRRNGDLQTIQQEEDTLFGSAGRGQSRLIMRLASTSHSQSMIKEGEILRVSAKNTSVVGEGARYLGYGVMETFPRKGIKAGQLTRACLRAPFDFTVQVRSRDLDARQQTSLEDALVALGTFGGMGAKSRKGYGSLVLQSLFVDEVERWRPSQTIAELEKTIEAFRVRQKNPNLPEFPEFTALSDQARHVMLLSNKKEPVELLDLVGRELVRYRSWGRGGKILSGKIPSERNFKDDHDLMDESMSGPTIHPRRIAFGLPHNYYFARLSPSFRRVGPHDRHLDRHDRHLDRRASPLFVHIHECGDSPVAILSFLPARFLPEGRSHISVQRRKVEKVEQKTEKELYRPIRAFLDRLLDRDKRGEPFTDVIEVGR